MLLDLVVSYSSFDQIVLILITKTLSKTNIFFSASKQFPPKLTT